jgi:hypothetical protein
MSEKRNFAREPDFTKATVPIRNGDFIGWCRILIRETFKVRAAHEKFGRKYG